MKKSRPEILQALKRDERSSMHELAERAGCSTYTVWTELQRLESIGLIQRGRGARAIRLTPKGRRVS